MQDLESIKKELAKIVEEKTANLIRLTFDVYYIDKRYPNIDALIEELEGKLATFRGLGKSISQEQKEEAIEVDVKLRELEEEKAHKKGSLRKIIESEAIIAELNSCIESPIKIYGDK